MSGSPSCSELGIHANSPMDHRNLPAHTSALASSPQGMLRIWPIYSSSHTAQWDMSLWTCRCFLLSFGNFCKIRVCLPQTVSHYTVSVVCCFVGTVPCFWHWIQHVSHHMAAKQCHIHCCVLNSDKFLANELVMQDRSGGRVKAQTGTKNA